VMLSLTISKYQQRAFNLINHGPPCLWGTSFQSMNGCLHERKQ
jgi:hypothetical protein